MLIIFNALHKINFATPANLKKDKNAVSSAEMYGISSPGESTRISQNSMNFNKSKYSELAYLTRQQQVSTAGMVQVTVTTGLGWLSVDGCFLMY